MENFRKLPIVETYMTIFSTTTQCQQFDTDSIINSFTTVCTIQKTIHKKITVANKKHTMNENNESITTANKS